MESRLRVEGHPIQPMLVTFPFGLFVCATLFDLADVTGGPDFLGGVAYWTAVAALVAAALAGLAGMVDLWDAPGSDWAAPRARSAAARSTTAGPRPVGPGDRTRRTAVAFNLVNAAMAGLFVVVCLVRAGVPDRGASGGLVTVELLALVVGAVGVRLGAVLVRQFDEGRGDATTFDAIGPLPGTVLGESAQPG